jgi:hypothetical protein
MTPDTMVYASVVHSVNAWGCVGVLVIDLSVCPSIHENQDLPAPAGNQNWPWEITMSQPVDYC